MKLKLRHVYITVGPTSCGKTYLCNRLREQSNLIKVISSDEWRHFVLRDKSLHKHDPQMLGASNAAFKMLFADLEQSLSFPQSLINPIVIVDTTGLSNTFREEVCRIAYEHNYQIGVILFNYDKRSDYEAHYPADCDKKLLHKHIQQTKIRVPELTATRFNYDVIRITKPLTHFKCEIEGETQYMSHHLQKDVNYLITTDVHCRLDMLINLLKKSNLFELDEHNNIVNANGQLIINGDWIDKNVEQLSATVHWLYHNRQHIHLVLGNHENFNYKVLTGAHTKISDRERQYFDSFPILQKDEQLSQMFCELVNSSHPFLIHPHFVCNHSPCENKWIGALDKTSVNKQVRNRYPFKEEEETEEQYLLRLKQKVLFDSDNECFNSRWIINGHVKLRDWYRHANRLLIDTGAEIGHKLTGLIFYKDSSQHFVCQHVEDVTVADQLHSLLDLDKPKTFSEFDLLSTQKFLQHNPVQFLSATISPAPADDNSLESLEKAFDIFRKKGVNTVVMQLKRMGSNCILHMNKDRSKCYTSSRRGFIINKIEELTDELNVLLDHWHKRVFNQFPDATVVILSGELEPWNKMGDDWIDTMFFSHLNSVRTENTVMQQSGFYDLLAAAINQEGELTNHQQKVKQLAKKADKFIVDNAVEIANLNTFEEQLNAYVYKADMFFSCFNILKIDDKVLPYDNYEGWHMFCDTAVPSCITVNVTDEAAVAAAQLLYTQWKTESKQLFNLDQIEGVVVKPLDSHELTTVPAIKVRTDKYLTLVYGPNYKQHFEQLIAEKSVKQKMNCSREQWKIGYQMLDTDLTQVSTDEKHIYLTAHFKKEEQKVEQLDPRL